MNELGRWWFIPNFHSHKIVFQNDRFFVAIKRAWWSIKDNLLQVHPTSMDEWLHQPLVWNPLFLDDEGSMLGRRVRLNWAQVDSSFASSLSNWYILFTTLLILFNKSIEE